MGDYFLICLYNQIKNVRASNKFLVFYDVCSLFTNIPLTETTDIAVGLIFENNTRFKISKVDLKELFRFATSGIYLFWQWNHHWALFLPIFMGFYEQKWLQSFEECEVILYRSYVDDIIYFFLKVNLMVNLLFF